MSAETLAGVGQIAGFMITDGGPHPPEKWADATTQQIANLIVVEPSAPVQVSADKSEFVSELFKLLCAAHTQIQKRERDRLACNGGGHLATALDVRAASAVATRRVMDLAQTFPRFAEHFSKPETLAVIYAAVGQHFADNAHIERCWYADRNPDDPHAQAFKQQAHARG